jgi:hypothetical protein
MAEITREDLLAIVRENPNWQGVSGLWLLVVYDAVQTIRAGREAEGYADAVRFIQETDGPFDCFVKTNDIDPAFLRRVFLKTS